MNWLIRKLGLSAIALCTVGVAASALGHHSAANQATEGKPIQWQGTVALVSWDGAHVMYRIEVMNANGSMEPWQVLGGSPYRLAKRGIFQATVKAGDAVTVAGYLNPYNKIITPVYFAVADGSKLFVGYDSSDAAFNAFKQTD